MSTSDTDEKYVLDLCDKALGITSTRQHNFDFPVDGYYDDYKIAITYCEKQNTDIVNYFAKHNIQLIEICFTFFNCDKQNRIIRNKTFDEQVIRRKLTRLS